MQTDGAKIDGRMKRRKRPRKPKDVQEFLEAIKDAARELDFALRMYAIELKEQLFTDKEIEREVRAAFIRVAREVLNEDA